MQPESSAERTRLEIIRLCHSALDSRTLRVEVLKRLRMVIPFDATFFSTTDPATLLFTSSLIDFSLPTPARMKFIENEYLQDDFNKFLLLLKNRLAVGVLSAQTEGELDLSGMQFFLERRGEGRQDLAMTPTHMIVDTY